MSARPTYSDEFKADAVALAASSGRPLPAVATDLGISLTALKRWIRLAREADQESGGKPDDPVDPVKFKAMEARLRELERENDFLKKVSAFFAKEQR
jgi:transposase